MFESESDARKFASASGVGGYLPLDTGKHVFVNWEPIRMKSVYHHPRMNPFLFEENQGLRADYDDDVCPDTLDICSRAVVVRTDPDWTESDLERKVAACEEAAKAI